MKLSQDTLADYFSLPDSNRSIFLVGKMPYDFISRNSNTLVVTIGDSWTWGADLTKLSFNGLHHNKLADDADYRLANVFGGIVASSLHADFLNLGESGASNYYIANKLLELSKIRESLEYTNIIVVCVFTEVARDFNGSDDSLIDYYSWLSSNINTHSDYYNLLKFINSNVTDKIVPLLNKFNIYFATNFVDPIGFENISQHFLSKSWLQVWCEHKQIQYPEPCYVVSPWVFEKLEQALDINPNLNRTNFLIWAADALASANNRAAICKKDNVNFGNLLHPLAEGHRVWAQYILEQIQ